MPRLPPRTVQDWVDWGAGRLRRSGVFLGHGTDNEQDEAWALVRWALALPHRPGAATLRKVPDRAQQRRLRALVADRIRLRKPAAYLTGEAWFAGLRFEVDERVIVPRSPIAELVVGRFRPWITRDPRRILDLCAGSGCIAIACARAFPRAKADAIELDPGAFGLLGRNIARHRLGRRVRALQSDLFGALRRERYDLIVSNPPYVPAARWTAMPAEFRHEPKMALISGRDGMDIVARILAEAPRFMAADGVLVCEVGGSVPEFTRRFPGLPVIWPEFEYGGDGVFVISRKELMAWNHDNVR